MGNECAYGCTFEEALKWTKEFDTTRLTHFESARYHIDKENYCDKHRASSHGIYTAKVSDLHEDYIKPQENVSHYDCSYVDVEGGGCKLTALSERTFSFNASVYMQEELTEKNITLNYSHLTIRFYAWIMHKTVLDQTVAIRNWQSSTD